MKISKTNDLARYTRALQHGGTPHHAACQPLAWLSESAPDPAPRPPGQLHSWQSRVRVNSISASTFRGILLLATLSWVLP